MKSKLTYIYLITALLLSVITYAQNTSVSAKTLLDDVSSKVKSYSNISIDFKYATESSANEGVQETRGNVIIEGDKYVLNILGITRIFDGKTLYTINPEDEEVTISSNNTADRKSVV